MKKISITLTDEQAERLGEILPDLQKWLHASDLDVREFAPVSGVRAALQAGAKTVNVQALGTVGECDTRLVFVR
jgi:hypothetical protein